MLIEVLLGGGIATVSGIAGFLISKKITASNFGVYTDQARAKAGAIEHEAELVLKKARVEAQELESELISVHESNSKTLQKEFIKKEQVLKDLEKQLITQKNNNDNIKNRIEKEEAEVKRRKASYEDRIDEMTRVLETGAGMTRDEAKQQLMLKIEEQSRTEIAHIVRKYENEAKAQAQKKANFIIAQATTRFASEFAQERLVNVVNLPDDELKGRIIGREGRNIKILENLLGVDIIIDDTPNAIVLSSFNLYRRAVATKTIELLVEDGRIQPARIEDIYEKVTQEFEDITQQEGEDIIHELGISVMNPELTHLIGRLRYRASFGQNALAHSLEVAHLAGIMAAEMGGDPVLAKRAGILHDIGKALTHEHVGSHVDLGAEVCTRANESDVVINAIYAHHGLQEAKTVECAAVCTADALSAARPGARREVLESFIKRVKEIEEIASSRSGVKQAYAINAGRELRVTVNATLVNDDESVLLSREIAQDIEKNVQYPGDIKVTVIRETRAVEFAH